MKLCVLQKWSCRESKPHITPLSCKDANASARRDMGKHELTWAMC